jgi:uncharacterized membrane protein YoaK (UPF0700 family)
VDRQWAYLTILMASPIVMFMVHMVTGRIYVKTAEAQSSPLKSAIWAILISFGILAFLSCELFIHSLDNPAWQWIATIY